MPELSILKISCHKYQILIGLQQPIVPDIFRFGELANAPNTKELLIRQLGLLLMILIFQHWEELRLCLMWNKLKFLEVRKEPDMEPMGWQV